MEKFNMFFDIEKEEQWLNEQLQKGYRLSKISGLGFYKFETTDKKYVVRLDYQEYLTKEKLDEYKGIYEDFGWTYIKGSSFAGIRYWQKEDDGNNEIFSDRQSKSSYYSRLMKYSVSLCLLSMFAAFIIFKDSGLYLTEGLWSMKGSMFWKAFLFESPFALFRLFPAILAVLFGRSYYKARRKYSMLKEQ